MSSSSSALPILSFGSISAPSSSQLPQFPTLVLPNPSHPLPQLPTSSSTTPRSNQTKSQDSFPSLNNSSKHSSSSLPDLKHLARSVLNAKKIAIVCGAGISTASGIPDFRSSSGLFESLKKQYPDAKLSSGKDLFDVGLFASEQNAGIFYNMIAELRKQTDEVEPTKFHEWLKELDDMGKLFRVYTQNIDSLEERAGLSYGLGNTSLPLPPRYGSRSPSKPKATKRSTSKALKPTDSSASSTASPFSLPNSSQASTVSSLSLRRSSSLSSLSSLSSCSSTTSTPPPPTHSSIPRCIPLHGHLSTLSCALCSNSFPLHPFLPLLSSGQPPLCPTCHTIDQERSELGRRSRGVGVLKPDVVLYGERHKDGDRIGEITQRDLMGVRPDLLIVVGTTLKVPGTKKLVKELSKVIKPPTKEGGGSKGKGKGKKISTIFLNKEFPGGGKEWKEVFDVWCRGDIQEFVEEVKKEKERMEEEIKVRLEKQAKPLQAVKIKVPNSKPMARPRARPSSLRQLPQPTPNLIPTLPLPSKPSFSIEIPPPSTSASNPLKRRRSSPTSTVISTPSSSTSTTSSTRSRRTSTLLLTQQSLVTNKPRSTSTSGAGAGLSTLGFTVTKKSVASVTGTKGGKVEKKEVEVKEKGRTRSGGRK